MLTYSWRANWTLGTYKTVEACNLQAARIDVILDDGVNHSIPLRKR